MDGTAQVTVQVTVQVEGGEEKLSAEVQRLLHAITGAMASREIQERLELKHREHFRTLPSNTVTLLGIDGRGLPNLEDPMRKPAKKLTLSRETLQKLVDVELSEVQGAYPVSWETRCDACPQGQTISCGLC